MWITTEDAIRDIAWNSYKQSNTLVVAAILDNTYNKLV